MLYFVWLFFSGLVQPIVVQVWGLLGYAVEYGSAGDTGNASVEIHQKQSRGSVDDMIADSAGGIDGGVGTGLNTMQTQTEQVMVQNDKITPMPGGGGQYTEEL